MSKRPFAGGNMISYSISSELHSFSTLGGKRKWPSMPDDGIKSHNEKLVCEQELASAERVMVSDGEFTVISRKRRI